MEGFIIMVLAMSIIIAIYFVPSIIASVRHAKHSDGIVALNFFLGWTVLGWIAAMIWAIVEQEARTVSNWEIIKRGPQKRQK